MILRARGLVDFSSSAAEGRVLGVALLPFFWSKALKSSFLPASRQALPLGPGAAADSPVGDSAVFFTGEWELGLLPVKPSPVSFQPSSFLLDLCITVNKSSVVREATNTSSSSSAIHSAVLSLIKLFSSALGSTDLPGEVASFSLSM